MTSSRSNRGTVAAAILMAQLAGTPGHAALPDPPFLVADINPVRRDYNPTSLAGFGGDLYFSADVRSRGLGLWRTDGSYDGTVLVQAGFSRAPTVAGHFLYFEDATGISRTDGTADGLTLLFTRPSGTTFVDLVAVGDRLFFDVYGLPPDDPRDDRPMHELWTTDGTTEGTVMLHSFPSGDYGFPLQLTDVNGTLFFTADDGSGFDLWKSDGTTAGTLPVTRFASTGGEPLTYPLTQLAAVGPLLFFVHPSGFLWRSDGTSEGTASLGVAPQGSPASAQNALIFVVLNEIWRSDGTDAGTFRLTSFDSAAPVPYSGLLTAANGSVFFFVARADGFDDLWRTDGTAAGTALVRNGFEIINILEGGPGRYFYFLGVRGAESGLWRSDGTEAGTVRIKEGGAAELTDVNGMLLFVSNGIWQSDGTAAGTRPLSDIFRDTLSSEPLPYADVNGTLLFAADDGSHGRELWRSDGTAGGTGLVKDIRPFGDGLSTTSFSSNQPDVQTLNGALFFAANDGNGIELWRSDGSEGGTWRVKKINDGVFGSYPFDLTLVNGNLLFWADDGVHGFEPWTSDGTTEGTRLLSDVLPGPASSLCTNQSKCLGPFDPQATRVGGRAFFVAASNGDELELWKTDGTTEGTERVSDPFPPGTQPRDLVVADGLLFFRLDDPNGESGIWRSDGTRAGTFPLLPVHPGSMASAGGTLIFADTDAINTLLRTDGSQAGTSVIRDLPFGIFLASALVSLGDEVVFLTTGSNGASLWRSDGTDSGTVSVKDLPAELPLSYHLTAIDGIAYFTVGGEIWRSDGSQAGTFAIADFGLRFLAPNWFTRAGSNVFFAAEAGEAGNELWALPVAVAEDTPTATATLAAPSATPTQPSPTHTMVSTSTATPAPPSPTPTAAAPTATNVVGTGSGGGCHLGAQGAGLGSMWTCLTTALVLARARRRRSAHGPRLRPKTKNK